MFRHHFVFLFAGLLAMLAAEPLLEAVRPDGSIVQLAFTLTLVLGVWSLQDSHRWFRVGLVLTALSVFTSGAYAYTGHPAAQLANFGVISIFCAVTIALAAQQVLLSGGPVTLNRIMGALCVYLLLGTLWSMLFGFAEFFLPSAFDYGGSRPQDAAAQFLYYSFVTLTTLGYGDVTPVHPIVRTLSYLEAVIGQLYLAVLVASLVGRYGRLALEKELQA